MTKILKTIFFAVLFFSFAIIFSGPARAEVLAPKIIKIDANNYSFSLVGAAPFNSEALIYLDNYFIGQAKPIASQGDEDCVLKGGLLNCREWRYESKKNLTPGNHKIIVISQDQTSLVLSAPTKEIKFSLNGLPAPTIITPAKNQPSFDPRPVVSGLARSDTAVKIYLDDVLIGQTEILTHQSGTANFAFKPGRALSPGWHKISAIAENSAGENSVESAVLNFFIEWPLPAPIVFKPVLGNKVALDQIFIVGLAKNYSRVKVYIDKKYQGEAIVKNHQSGAASFSFKPRAALTRGAHVVYTMAIDKRGKISSSSNNVSFTTMVSAIAESAEEERRQAIAKIKEAPEPAKAKAIIISKDSGQVEEKANEESRPNDKIGEQEKRKEIIKQETANREKAELEKINKPARADSSGVKSGSMLNEETEKQGKLRLNIIIFILFLLGVVVWLLWVNRELAKEQRARNQALEKTAEEKNDNTPRNG